MSAIKLSKLVLKEVLDLPAAVAGFYVQEAVIARINGMQKNTMIIRLEDEIREFNAIHRKYTDRLAGAFFDYIALASFGEARHAPSQAKCYILQICYNWNRDDAQQNIHTRTESYKKALRFDPYRFLPVLSILFHDGQWKDAYGGKRWGDIAKAGMMYKEVSSTVFVDYVVDLSHNGGSMFNKNILFQFYSGDSYIHMLSMKRTFSILEDANFLKTFSIAQNAKPFLKLAAKLGLIPTSMIYSCAYESIEFPETIKWGMLPIMESDILSCENLSSNEEFNEDNDKNDDDESNDNDEDNDENDDDESNDDDEEKIKTFDDLIRSSCIKPYLDEIQAKFKPMTQTSMF